LIGGRGGGVGDDQKNSSKALKLKKKEGKKAVKKERN